MSETPVVLAALKTTDRGASARYTDRTAPDFINVCWMLGDARFLSGECKKMRAQHAANRHFHHPSCIAIQNGAPPLSVVFSLSVRLLGGVHVVSVSVRKVTPPHTEAGATAHEIGAVTGHKTLALVQRYTEAAGREGMADSAIEKLIARPNGERNLANLPKRFVKSDTNPKQGKDNL
jgi:hypothetical protein